MKEFVNVYTDVLQTNHEQVGQVHIDFKRQCLDLTVEKLLEQFVQSKYTGFGKPGMKNCKVEILYQKRQYNYFCSSKIVQQISTCRYNSLRRGPDEFGGGDEPSLSGGQHRLVQGRAQGHERGNWCSR